MPQPAVTVGKRAGFGGEYGQAPIAAQGEQQAQDKRGNEGGGHAETHHFVAALKVARRVVLADEGNGGLAEGVHEEIGVELEVHGSRRAGGGIGTEHVDLALDNDVGKGEYRALKCGGEADVHHGLQVGADDARAAQDQAVALFFGEQEHHDDGSAHGIGHHRARGDAEHAHVQHGDGRIIEHDV